MKKVYIISTITGSAGMNGLLGITDFANKHREWSTRLAQIPEDIPETLLKEISEAKTDGIIMSFRRMTPLAHQLLALPIPTVQVHADVKQPAKANGPYALIQNDNVTVGREAARYFLSRGNFRSFAFLPTDEPTDWARKRGRGFCQELEKSKIKVFVYAGPELLAQFIKKLPKPAAILAATDLEASNAIETCVRLNIKIPIQVAILGVDDNEVFCESQSPTLSSIHTGDRQLGYRAAQELDRLMRGKRSPSAPILIPPRNVVERDSTRSIPPAGYLVHRGVEFIRHNFSEGISARDVIRHLGVSDSLARLRFRTIYGKSIGEAIQDVRLSTAKTLLSNTDYPVGKIAEKCGISSVYRFSAFFKEMTGLSPSSWRHQSGES